MRARINYNMAVRMLGTAKDLAPVLALLLCGVGLRLFMAASWDIYYSHDFDAHLALVDWFAQTLRLPPLALSRAAYHPPLYYLLAGRLVRAGLSIQGLALVGALLGCLRLLLFAAALEVLPLLSTLPRAARRFALALMVFMPSSVHGEVMLGGETLQNLLALCSLVLVALLFHAPRRLRRSLLLAIALGLTLGVGVLVKISALMLLAALALGALAEALWLRDGGLRGRLQRLAPLALCGLIATATSGPYLARNHHLHGKPLLTSFDAYDRALMQDLPPYLARRAPSFFVGWPPSFFALPYNARAPRPSFLPVLVATTFVDYYNYAFAPYPEPGQPRVEGPQNPLRPDALRLGQLSMLGGTLLALATALGFVVALIAALRRRDAAQLTLLAAPLLILLGQLHFATAFPFDFRGQIKGSYMLLTAPVLCVVLGATWDALRRRGALGRALAAVLLLALGMVALYATLSPVL